MNELESQPKRCRHPSPLLLGAAKAGKVSILRSKKSLFSPLGLASSIAEQYP
jgi:hypothetical protein